MSSAQAAVTRNGNGKGNGGGGRPDKTYRNKKKMDEVKEIIQNKPDVEISRVLEYFDNDVGKCIDAFVTDGGKEALAKWNEKKKAKKNSNENGQKAAAERGEGESEAAGDDNGANKNGGAKGNKGNKKGAKSGNKQPQQQANGTNGSSNAGSTNGGRGSANRGNNYISDLVSSIIDHYTGPNAATTSSAPISTTPSSNTETLAGPNSGKQQTNQSQQLVDDLNRLVLSSTNNTATISGLKVTVMGIQSNNGGGGSVNHAGSATGNHHHVNSTAQTISSVSSSPSSMSSSSSTFDSSRHTLLTQSASQPTTNGGGRPSLLELKTNGNGGMMATPLPQRTFNKQINNTRARELLEKPQKDLQRQSTVLAKIATVFQEEANKGQLLLVQTFSQLHKLLDQRQAQLQAQLMASVQTGNDLLRQRQAKAAALKLSVDNSVHLTDDETLELKADIKHFVSERQLDEEFGKIKLFEDNNNNSELVESIQRAGAVTVVTNKYAKQRPPLNELLNGNGAMTPLTPAPASQAPAPAGLPNGKGAAAASSKQPAVQNGNHRGGEQLDTNNNRNAPGVATAATNGHHGLKSGNNGVANGVKAGGLEFGDDKGEGEFIEVKKNSRRNKPKPQQQQHQLQQSTNQQAAEAAPAQQQATRATNGHHGNGQQQQQNGGGGGKGSYSNGGHQHTNGAKFGGGGTTAKPPRNGQQEVRAH